jgi:hypothetical protein
VKGSKALSDEPYPAIAAQIKKYEEKLNREEIRWGRLKTMQRLKSIQKPKSETLVRWQ